MTDHIIVEPTEMEFAIYHKVRTFLRSKGGKKAAAKVDKKVLAERLTEARFQAQKKRNGKWLKDQ